MRPVFAKAEEKILAGHDEDLSLLQPFVKLAGRDRQPLEPQPVEKRAFTRVQPVVDPPFAENVVQPLLRLLIALPIERTQDRAPDLEDGSVFNQRLHQALADVPVGQPDNRRHRPHRLGHLRRSDHDARSRPGKPELRKAQSQDRVQDSRTAPPR